MLTVKRSEIYDYLHINAKELIYSLTYPDNRGKDPVCPICGNGTGSDGTGMQQKENGYFKCYVCEFDGDIVNLVSEMYKITDPNEALLKTCELLNIELENDQEYKKSTAEEDFKHIEILENGTIIEHTPKTQKTAPISQDRLELDKLREERKKAQEEENRRKNQEILDLLDLKARPYEGMIKQARANLAEPEAVKYITGRGISMQTAKRLGVGYMRDLFVGNRTFKECIVFPSTYGSYSVRDMDPNVSKNDKARKPKGAPDIPFCIHEAIQNPEKPHIVDGRQRGLEPLFVVEGLFDAISIYEVGGDAISLNGLSEKLLIKILQEKDIKRPILLSLDGDTRGREKQEKTYQALKDAGFKVFNVDLLPGEFEKTGIKDANDYLIADRKGFEKTIKESRELPTLEFAKGLNKGRKELFKNGIAASVNTPAIPTGFKTLDSTEFLDGGLYEGLYIFGAISSLGKTSLMLQIADQIAAAGHDVLYFSLEMSANELIAKSISRYTAKDLIEAGQDTNFKARTVRGILDGKRYKYYSEPEKAHINQAIDDYFNDTGDTMRIIEGIGTIDTDYIRAEVEKHIKYTGRAPVVFIDYLQLLAQRKEPDGRRYSMTDKQIVDANVLALKQLSRDFKMPIFTISSFNRDNYSNSVSMQSFKESGAIEYSSDLLLGMERIDQTEKKEAAIAAREQAERETGICHLRLVVLKNRNGQRGGKMLLDFYNKFNYFRDAGNEAVKEEFKGIDVEDPRSLFL